MKESQKPCTEEILRCGDTCDKPLNCGAHKCISRCHFGECETVWQISMLNLIKYFNVNIEISVSTSCAKKMQVRHEGKRTAMSHWLYLRDEM